MSGEEKAWLFVGFIGGLVVGAQFVRYLLERTCPGLQ